MMIHDACCMPMKGSSVSFSLGHGAVKVRVSGRDRVAKRRRHRMPAHVPHGLPTDKDMYSNRQMRKAHVIFRDCRMPLCPLLGLP